MINGKADNPDKGLEEFLESGNIFEIDSSMRSANPSWPGVTSILMSIEERLDQELRIDRNPTDPLIERRRIIENNKCKS